MTDRMSAHIWWSIYVKTSNMRKLRQAHLPPIELALENIEFEWQIVAEKENPGLFRLMTYQNFEIEHVEEIVIPLLRRAYKLQPMWTIQGLDDLSSGRLQHIYGSCAKPRNSNRPPALETIVFEVQPGHILPMTDEGAWPVVNMPPQTDDLKPTQIRRPKQPD